MPQHNDESKREIRFDGHGIGHGQLTSFNSGGSVSLEEHVAVTHVAFSEAPFMDAVKPSPNRVRGINVSTQKYPVKRLK